MDSLVGRARALTLEDYFTGQVRATGFVRSLTGKVIRRFHADFVGMTEGERTSIVETLDFDDGEHTVRNWSIDRTGPASYRGRGDDLLTPAHLDQISSHELRWRYHMAVPVSGRAVRMAVHDVMVLCEDDMLVSVTVLRKFGVTLARIHTVYQRAARPPWPNAF